MKKLQTLKQSGKLRKTTDLRPVKQCLTRWSGNFFMLKRYFQLEAYIDKADANLAVNIPSVSEVLKLKKLLEIFENFQSVTTELQNEDITLAEVRILFDGLIGQFPIMEKYLDENSEIVHSPKFEFGLVKIIKCEFNEMDDEEKSAMKKFEQEEPQMTASRNEDGMSFAKLILSGAKNKKLSSPYRNLNWVKPTTVMVERLFSRAGFVLTPYRQKLLPINFEADLFLLISSEYWDNCLVNKLVA